MSGPADFKSVPGFENEPRFVGVIEQNKIQQTFFHYCNTCSKGLHEFLTILSQLRLG